jgi:hypothetical protein
MSLRLGWFDGARSGAARGNKAMLRARLMATPSQRW